MTAIQTTVLDHVALVLVSLTTWSGTKKLESSDFSNVNVDDLPSTRVASYGIKHLIDPERLSVFRSMRSKADRICTRYGVRFLGGYAIPQDSIQLVGADLTALCAEFQAELDAFIADYDRMVDDWIHSNPDFSAQLRRSMLPREEVRSRFRASYSIFEMAPSPHDTSGSLSSVSNDLLESVLAGVCQTIKPYLDRKSGSATDGFRPEVRTTISDIAAKLRRFSFVGAPGALEALANDLDAAVHGSGRIQGTAFDHLWALLRSFANPEDALRAVELRAAGTYQPLQPVQPTLLQNKSEPSQVLETGNPSAEPLAAIGDTAGTFLDESALLVSSEPDATSFADFSFDMFDSEDPATETPAPIQPTQAPSPAAFTAALDW